MRKMKDSGVEWIGEIPEAWNVKRFKFYFDIIGGNGFKEEFQGQTSGEYPFCKASDIKGNEKEVSTAKNYVSEQLAIEQKYNVIPEGSILIPKIGEALKKNHRKINRVPCIVDNNCEAFKVNRNDCIEYLYYVTKCIDMNWFANGGTIPSVNNEKLRSFWLPFPEISVQQTIADYLDAKCSKMDAIIAKQEAIIEKLKEYKLSVITEAVTKGLNPNVEMKDSEVRFVNKTPTHWESRKMLSILSCRVVDGPHESPELFDTGIPYISATAIVNGKIDFSLMRGYISEEYCDLCDRRYTPQIGDLLVVKLGASTGQVAIVDTNRRFNIWVPLAAVRCNDEAIPKFVYYAFQSDYFIRQMELSWTFGTQQTLGVQTIERLRIVLPPLNEQKEIVDYLDNKYVLINKKIEKTQQIIKKFEDYKKSLIYEVVTGKKEV